MRKLLIVGAGGHGAVVANIAKEMGVFEEIAFLDDGNLTECLGCPVIDNTQNMAKYVKAYQFFVAVGNNTVREKISISIKNLGGVLATLIHPKAIIAKSVEIGEGTVVMAGSVIEPRAVIGKGCIINTSSSLNHDVKVGDYVHVAVGAHVAGTVSIGNACWIGIGVTIKNNVNICPKAFLGAGCVVVKDINEEGTYVGVPAKRIVKND